VNQSVLKLGDRLYRRAYTAYLPLYSAYKAISDRKERRVLRSILRPGMTVVDVGANIGIYTRYLARLCGPNGRVVAFEPSPDNLLRLNANVRKLPNVTIHAAAVGDRSGSIPLYLSPHLNVDHRTYEIGEARDRIDVPVVRLDDIFPPGGRVDLLKVDVQGFEGAVLEGARRLMSENLHLKAVIEYWPYGLAQGKRDPNALLGLLAELGLAYEVIGSAEDPARFVARLDPARSDHYCNLLVRRREEGGA
jgi:FkbM family methyltransferase